MNNVVLMTNYLMGRMRRIFFMSYPETKYDYKKSRIYYTVGDTAAQTIVQLAGGTFLVALMENLGISDGNMGIIASFGSMAAVFQILSMKLAGIMTKNKLFVCLTVLQKLWLSFIFFIPFFQVGDSWKRIIMVVCFCFAQICIQVGSPATVDWIANLVPMKLRGRYFSIKDAVAIMVQVTTTLILGILMDVFKKTDITQAFIILGIITAIFVIVNVVAFVKMKEPRLGRVNEAGQEMHGALAKKSLPHLYHTREVKLLQECREAFRTQNFRKLLLLNCLWLTAFNIASPFNTSFHVKDLALPYTYLTIVSFISSMCRVYISPKVGRMADKKGMPQVLAWALEAMGIHFLIMMLSNPSNAYVMTFFACLFSALAWSFIGIGMFGIQLEFLEEHKRIVQYSLFSALSGLYAFLISFIGGKFIDFVQSRNWMLFGQELYAQQFTNLMGVLFIVITVIYLKKKIQPVISGKASGKTAKSA